MSTSFYRGKVVTSPKLKGAFTEACDELKGRPFDILFGEAKTGIVEVWPRRYTSSVRSILIGIGNRGLVIEIKEDGGFEILEGAA